jgi:hypothetical protein
LLFQRLLIHEGLVCLGKGRIAIFQLKVLGSFKKSREASVSVGTERIGVDEFDSSEV